MDTTDMSNLALLKNIASVASSVMPPVRLEARRCSRGILSCSSLSCSRSWKVAESFSLSLRINIWRAKNDWNEPRVKFKSTKNECYSAMPDRILLFHGGHPSRLRAFLLQCEGPVQSATTRNSKVVRFDSSEQIGRSDQGSVHQDKLRENRDLADLTECAQ